MKKKVRCLCVRELGNGSIKIPSERFKKPNLTFSPSSGLNTSFGLIRLRNQEDRKPKGFEEITTSHTKHRVNSPQPGNTFSTSGVTIQCITLYL